MKSQVNRYLDLEAGVDENEEVEDEDETGAIHFSHLILY